MSVVRLAETAMSEPNELRAYLQRHPKTLTTLSGLLVLLSQVGTVAAGNSAGIPGP